MNAQELLSDRRFTLEDVYKAIAMAKIAKTQDGLIDMDAWISNGYEGAAPAYSTEEIIQSLSKTSWPVELEMEQIVFTNGNSSDLEISVNGLQDTVLNKPKLTDGKVKILRLL
jgi:hypothetical protein